MRKYGKFGAALAFAFVAGVSLAVPGTAHAVHGLIDGHHYTVQAHGGDDEWYH